MKKRWLFVLSAILAASILAGAENAGISRSPEGLFQVEQLAFGIVYWGKEWKTIILQRKTPGAFTFPGEGGTETPNGLRRDGTFQVSDTERFNFSETVRQPSANEAEFQFSLKADPGIPTEYITWQTLFTQAEYARNPAVFNGETLPAVKNKDTYRPAKKNSELVLPLKQGVLKIRGNFAVIVRELDWGVDVRLLFAGSHGAVRNATLSGVMTYQPYSARTLDLRPVLNMGFTDEAANDRRGGWTDQGPDNDLRAMTPGTREFAGIPFDVVDPAKNSEKSCLALAGAARPWFAKEAAAAVAPGVSGEALYLLNALAWAPAPNTVSGTVRVAYADGSSQTFELKCGVDTGNFWSPMPLRNAAVGWRAQNGEAGIGLYVTRLPLDASKQVSQVEFRSAGQVWMLLGATVSNRTPDNQSQLEKLVMKPNNAWTEFAFDLPTQPGSAADLSFLADAPAGKYGFLKVRGDEFEFEKRPGIPVRFWGTNLCIDALFQPETETAGMLDELKSMGYNSIRLHHFDQMLAREPERMRNLDFLFAEAKKRGIYLTLDLFTTRYPNRLAGFDKLTPNEYKLLCYFNEEAYRDLLAFAKQLLGHVNPYTGDRKSVV